MGPIKMDEVVTCCARLRGNDGIALPVSKAQLASTGLNIQPATATAKSCQLCPTLCDPTDDSPPGFPFPGILQARTLDWVAISFSNA